MNKRLITILIVLTPILIVAGWTYVLYTIDPTTPFLAFFLALLIYMPATIMAAAAVAGIYKRIKNGEPVWIWQEPKPRKLPLWYRILSKIFP